MFLSSCFIKLLLSFSESEVVIQQRGGCWPSLILQIPDFSRTISPVKISQFYVPARCPLPVQTDIQRQERDRPNSTCSNSASILGSSFPIAFVQLRWLKAWKCFVELQTVTGIPKVGFVPVSKINLNKKHEFYAYPRNMSFTSRICGRPLARNIDVVTHFTDPEGIEGWVNLGQMAAERTGGLQFVFWYQSFLS